MLLLDDVAWTAPLPTSARGRRIDSRRVVIWPPDCNPVDYYFAWGVYELRVRENPEHKNQRFDLLDQRGVAWGFSPRTPWRSPVKGSSLGLRL